MYLQPQTDNKKAKLNSLEIWWANLLPPQIKAIMPHWSISGGIVTLMAVKCGSQMLINMVSLFWASMAFTLVFRALKPYLGKHKWLIAAYHALLFALVTKPVFAQAADAGAVCTNTDTVDELNKREIFAVFIRE